MTTMPPPPLTAGQPLAPQSATDAIMPALENVKRVLFQPFSLKKWLVLGFIAFLAGAMNGGGGGGGGGPSGPGGGGSGGRPDIEGAIEHATSWLQANLDMVITGAILGTVVVVSLGLLMLYISSIFRFIFMESVITNQTKIREAWHRNKAEGVSYMWWRVGFGLLCLFFAAIVIGLPVLFIVLSIVNASKGGAGQGGAIAGSILGIVVVAFGALAFAIVTGLISAMTRDFVLPLMYVKRIGVLDGWRRFWPVLSGNKVGFLVYFLLKIVAAVASGIVGLFGVLIAMLIAAIPLGLLGLLGYGLVTGLGIDSWEWWYLAVLIPAGIGLVLAFGYWVTCVLLPVPVFFQSYALKYLGFVEPEAQTI